MLVFVSEIRPDGRAKYRCARLQKSRTVLEPLICAGILLLVTAFLVEGSFNPFLYFRF